MVNYIENAHFKGSCGILWYHAVSCGIQTDPLVTVYIAGQNKVTFCIYMAKSQQFHAIKHDFQVVLSVIDIENQTYVLIYH